MSGIDQYLVAQTTHGPSLHGPLVVAFVLLVAVGGLVYLVRTRTGRSRSERDPMSDRDPESHRDPDA
ncbi:MAG: hypothetical protein MSC30_10470 [Gaiellaceae bacterium MAG52_C11]|nr:hypothetical protein [Candidatus Gaiellasilicea maunaloa]